MADLMQLAEKACRNKKLDIPELKTAEGAVALSACMDSMTGREGEGCGYERAGYAAVELIKWTDTLPLEVFRRDSVGIPVILERIRKIYNGGFFLEGHQFPLTYADYYGCASHSFVRLISERSDAWGLPYDYKKLRALKDNGYSFDWYSYPSNAIETHPDASWCEHLRLFPQKSESLVYDAIHTKRRDILECMKELNALSDAKVLEIMSSSSEETREFFRSVWYEEREEAPEISMVENLLSEADKLAVKTEAFLRLTREERLKSRFDYRGSNEKLCKLRGNIYKIVSGSPDAFCGKRELMKRALVHAPYILLSGEWRNNKEFYEIAFDRAEQGYILKEDGNWCSTYLAESSKKEDKEARLNAFKLLYPSDDEKRAFLKAHPTCAILGGFHGTCSKKVREDFAFWTDIYAHTVYLDVRGILPSALKKSQAFLKMCEPVKHIADFEKFFIYETADDLELVLAQKRTEIDMSKIPDSLRTRENIYRILEHESYNTFRLKDCIEKLDVTLFSDEEFVVGAAAYEIDAKEFFLRIDKPLRKTERVWRAWATRERIASISSDLPMVVKGSRSFAEHLLAIGAGVSFEGPVFAELVKKYPDLSDALVDAYVKELSCGDEIYGRQLQQWEQKRHVDEIPDEQLRELVSQKLFG